MYVFISASLSEHVYDEHVHMGGNGSIWEETVRHVWLYNNIPPLVQGGFGAREQKNCWYLKISCHVSSMIFKKYEEKQCKCNFYSTMYNA